MRWGEEYQFDIFIPHLYVEGVYNVDGQILLFPIKGSGKFTGNFSKLNVMKQKKSHCSFFSFQLASCSGSVTIVLPKHSLNDTVSIQKVDIDIKLGNGSIKLRNLFNGDKVLGKVHLSV